MMFHMIEIPIQWEQIWKAIGATGLVGTLILFLVKWLTRYRPKDISDNNKTDAETQKIRAEAAEIKAKADVTIVEYSLKMIQKLGDENEVTKKQLEKSQQDLSDALNSLRDAQIKMSEIQHELNNERQKNILMNEQIKELLEELNKLRKHE